MLLYYKPDVVMVAEVPDDLVSEIGIGTPCPLCLKVEPRAWPRVIMIDHQAGQFMCTDGTGTRRHVLPKDDNTVRVDGLDMLASDGRVFPGRVAKKH